MVPQSKYFPLKIFPKKLLPLKIRFRIASVICISPPFPGLSFLISSKILIGRIYRPIIA